MKNILVLTGSPRVGGNSDLLADAFIKGAKLAGHKVTKFEAAFKNINGCKACNKCYSNGSACVFNDDFNELAPLAEDSDMIVFVSPLYWFSFSAQIKAALDKFYAFGVGQRNLKIKESALITCGEDTDPAGYDGIVKSYELITGYKEWVDKGRIIVTGVNHKGDILNKEEYLEQAEKMGAAV